METINLNVILKRNCPWLIGMNENILNAMREACNKTVDMCINELSMDEESESLKQRLNELKNNII
jgi:hypothetical protein